MEKKSICIFIHGFAGGGAERMTVILANRLHELGHSVTFLVRYDYGEAREMLDGEIAVVNMDIQHKGKLSKNLINIRYLKGFLENRRFDAILCVTIEMSQVAAAASFLTPRRHAPLISVIHNNVSAERHSFDFIRSLLYPILDRRMTEVIAVSDAVGGDYRKVSRAEKEKVHTVYNPVISDKVLSQCMERVDHPWLIEKRNFRTLVLSGRLTYQKNHELMFDALKLLREGGADYRLILLGTGEREEELRELSRNMGLQSVIDFHGYVKNPYAYYAACDMLVLSSRYEGLPTVLIEGLACGCRIVSVDCPSGPREILSKGGKEYGILAPMDDKTALAKGIEEGFTKEPDMEELRRRAMDFNVDSAVNGYLNVIGQAVGRTEGTNG